MKIYANIKGIFNRLTVVNILMVNSSVKHMTSLIILKLRQRQDMALEKPFFLWLKR